jgi:hypothetical protein
VLLRVALHQTRFRTPGVAPDPRGVLLGPKGLLVFASLDRVVAFLRAVSEDGLLDELVPELDLRWVETPLGTRELTLSFAAGSSYRMDRVASLARLSGGGLFTGASRHFVRYRDASAPLGYDLGEVRDAAADLVVYDASYEQTYSVGRALPLRALLVRLAPIPAPEDEASGDALWVTAEVGIGHALIGYHPRSRDHARASLVEWPAESAFDDAPRRLHLVGLRAAPPRIVRLLRSLPGVAVFRPATEEAAVELGFRHPVALDGCASVFPEGTLTLFRGDGEVSVVEALPRFAPVAALVRTPIALRAPFPLRGDGRGEPPAPFALPLTLAPTQAPLRAVVATLVPKEQRAFLARLLYALPARILEGLSVALADEHVFLLDPRGIEGVPLGRFFTEVAPRVYVPAGMTLVPAVAPEVITGLVHAGGGGHVFFLPGEDAPLGLPEGAFAPLSTRVLAEISARPVHAEAPESHDVPLGRFGYDAPRRFPMRGVPEGSADAEGATEE